MQKRSVLLLTFLFLFSNSFARKRNHIRAGVSFMPAMMADEKFNYDVFKLSYVSGLQLYAGGEKFFFNTGIQYLHLVKGNGFQNHYPERDVSYVNGFDTTFSESKTTVRYHYLGFPLMASLALGESKTKFCIDAGAQVNYHIATGEKTIYRYKDGSEMIMKGQGLNDPRDVAVFFSPTVRIGIQRWLSEKFIIKVMPEISCHFSWQESPYWVVGINFFALQNFR